MRHYILIIALSCLHVISLRAQDSTSHNQRLDFARMYLEAGVKSQQQTTTAIEPGLTFGWDIVPGKTNEALILRTNLRWYPFSEFEVNGRKFNFSQLEYNLIQVVFYPERLKKRK